MEGYLILRALEYRDCPRYDDCLTQTALRDNKYVPCFECMGGVPMPQLFECVSMNCRTLWVEEDNKWLITKEVQCPFCSRTYKIAVQIQNGTLSGKVVHEPEIG